MFRKNIKLVVLAGALALATAVSPVFAEVNSNQIITDGNVPVEKTLLVDDGVTSINKTFTFTVTPVGEAAANINYTPSVSYSYSSLDLNGNELVKSGEKIAFSAKDNAVPGEYEFSVKETIVEDDENVTYDGTEYKIRVYLTNNNAENAGSGKVVVSSITAVDKDEDTDGKKTTKVSFENQYKAYSSLTLSKQVTGAGADPVHDKFSFKVTFDFPEWYDNAGTQYQLPTLTNGLSYANGATSTSFTINGFQDDKSVTFENLPVGTTYTVEEIDVPSGYTPSYTLNQGLSSTTSKNLGDKTPESVEDGLIYDNGSNAVEFTNDKPANPITGIITNNAPYIVLLGASG
ncbi:DUF7601 domain-containing protein, partial [Floccifex sp.]|uniref:DUF7601 domain-containing protein n=1 Tax=Floccifex sp. TaxID=2815810 RepID=UPI003F0A3862